MAQVNWLRVHQFWLFLILCSSLTLAQRWDAASPLSHFVCIVSPAATNFDTQSLASSKAKLSVIALYSGHSNITFQRSLSFGIDEEIPAGHEILARDENTTVLRLPSSNAKVGGAYSCEERRAEGVQRISTLVQSSNILVKPRIRTIRVGLHDPLRIYVDTDFPSKVVWRKNGEPLDDWQGETSVDIERASAIDTGLYECHLFGRRAEGLHGIVEVIVRGCPAGFWGRGCDEDCPNCLNGGVCDDVTGECACPPGFAGETCQNGLGSNTFGQLGQFTCGQEMMNNTTDCRGALLCTGQPFGCSCAAGFGGWDCTNECQNGTYGADCEQSCHCRDNALCRGDTGSCEQAGGCADGWTGINCQVPVQRIESFTAPYQPNIGQNATLACTATVNFTDTSLQILTQEGEQLLPVSIWRDVTRQTQTLLAEAPITSVQHNFKCALTSSGRERDRLIRTVSGSTPPRLTRPPRVLSTGEASVELAWTPWSIGTDSGQGPVIRYVVLYREQGAAEWQTAGDVILVSPDVTEDSLTFTVTSLKSRVAYEFSVIAVRPGPGGEGQPSPAVTAATDCSIPDPISNLQVSSSDGSSTSIQVTWDTPTQRLCHASHYTIYYDITSLDQCEGGAESPISHVGQSGSITASGSGVNIEGLHEYSSYVVTVAPVYVNGTGANTIASFTTGEGRPTSAPVPVEIADLSANSVTFNWGQVPCGHRKGAIGNYLVMLKGAQQGTQIVPATQHAYTFPDLKECIMYNFTVAAHTAAGVGPATSPVQVVIPATTAPGPIRNLRVTATATEIRLSWERPAQGACRLQYVIRYTPQILDQCIAQHVDKPIVAGETNGTTSFTIVGLVAYSTYMVEVLAVNSIGSSPPVNQTIKTGESVPENVTQLAVLNVTDNSISLSWVLQCGHTHGNILLFHYELSNENLPAAAALVSGDSRGNQTSLTINNLASCTPFEFRITAKTSAGFGQASRLHHVRTQGGVPLQIENMYVHTYPARPFEADVTWSPPETSGCPILFYRVTYVPLNIGMCNELTPNLRLLQFAGNTSHWFMRLSNLKPYTLYEVYVQAVSDAGVATAAARQFQTQPSTPSQVTQIAVADRTENSIQFHWVNLPCGDRHGPDVIYHYRLDSPAGLSWKGQVQHPESTAAVYGLSACMTYSFQIQAETSAGLGQHSLTVLAPTSASPPGPVTSLAVQPLGASELNVTWSPPMGQSCPIVSYGLRYFPTDKDQCRASVEQLSVRAGELETWEPTALVSGLAPFSTYSVIVWARTESPSAGQDALTTIITPQDTPTASPIVNEAETYPGNPYRLSISWGEVPCGHRRGNVSFYSYELRSAPPLGPDDDRKSPLYKTNKIPASLQHVTFEDLEPCQRYLFRVRARTRKGWGPYSTWTTQTTEAVVSDAVEIVLAETSSASPTSIRLSWQSPPNQKCPIITYIVTYRLVRYDRCLLDDDWPIEVLTVNPSHMDVEINSLQPFSTYELKVFAVTEAGNGTGAVAVVQTGETFPSEAPDSISVDLVTSREIEVSWREPPCGNRHGDVSHYQYRLLDAYSGRTLTSTTPDTVIQFGFLTPFTEYWFSVRASSVHGYGPFSRDIAIRTLPAPPPKPTGLKVIGIGETNVTIQWHRPNPPHGVIKEYKMQFWRQTDKSNQSRELSVLSEEEKVTFTLTYLTPYTAYVIQVRGVTTAGPGDWSDVINVGTSEGLPGPVTQVRVLNRTLSSIELTWEAPNALNGELLGYTISYAPALNAVNDGNWSSTTNRPVTELRSARSSHIVVSELDPATEYVFRISANNRVGDGSIIVITEFTKVPAPVVPKSPTTSTTVTEDNMVTIQLEPMGDNFISAYRVTVKHMNSISKRAADQYHRSIQDYPPYPGYPGHYTQSHAHWIAAEFGQQDLPNVFTVGDNKTYGGYHNAPLTPGNSYGISMCSVSRTTRDMASSCSQPIEVKAKPNPTSLSNSAVFPNELKAALGAILLVVMVAVLIVAVIRRRKRLHTTRPKEGITLSALESGGEGAPSLTNCTSATLPALSRTPALYKGKQRGLSVNALQNGQNQQHALRRTNGAMRQRPKTAPKPANPASMRSRWQAPPPVKIVELCDYVREKTANGDMCFKLDYERLPDGQMYTWEVATRQENVTKNRYINIIPYDHSRVVLETDADNPHEDFINASFVSGYLKPKAYIATQGPLSSTVVDFWRMVWQEKVPIIVMLTKLVENKKRKCDPYWPDDIETYGDFTVTVITERNYQNYTERTLTIKKAWDPEERRVQHFHYTSWPDMGLPSSATPLLEFVQEVKQFDRSPSGPTIVHCSAGVGRTGTFITLDAMMDMSARETQINILDFIYRMRTKRVKMVQTPEQYVFAYEALLEYLLCGLTSVPTKGIVPYFTRLEQTNVHTKRTYLEEHLKALDSMSICYSDMSMQAGKSPENHHKNRYPDIIPLDKYRPYLMTGCGDGQNNYINATFLDGFRRRDMYIATQTPLPHTVPDFWRMLYDYNSNVIVMLNDIGKNDQTCAQYWPVGDEAVIGPFVIDVSAEEREGDVIIRTFLLSNTHHAGAESSRVIRQYSFVGWKERQKYPKSLSSLLCLVQLVETCQREIGDHGPVTVHCTDGVTRSGLFCAIMSTITKLKSEGHIDVFHAVKKLRKCNGRMVTSEEQYLYIHDVVREYLASCEIYENYR